MFLQFKINSDDMFTAFVNERLLSKIKNTANVIAKYLKPAKVKAKYTTSSISLEFHRELVSLIITTLGV